MPPNHLARGQALVRVRENNIRESYLETEEGSGRPSYAKLPRSEVGKHVLYLLTLISNSENMYSNFYALVSVLLVKAVILRFSMVITRAAQLRERS